MYGLLAWAVSLAVAFGAGWAASTKWEKGQQALQQVKVIEKTVEVTKKVMVGQEQIRAAYEQGKASREEELKNVREQYDSQIKATLAALPTVCTWGDGTVGLLNNARGGAAAPSANGVAGGLPTPAVAR